MERKKGWLTSGAFAALCGTTKETLRHYKDISLLSPAHQGDNGYFYYDIRLRTPRHLSLKFRRGKRMMR